MNPRQNAANWSDDSSNNSHNRQNNSERRDRRRRINRSQSRDNRERSREQSPINVQLHSEFQEPAADEFVGNEERQNRNRRGRGRIRIIGVFDGSRNAEINIRRNLHEKISDFIALLPVLKRKSDEKCMICLECFGSNERVLLECNHAYHPECLKNYFDNIANSPIEPISGNFREMICPLCKEDYTDKIKLIGEDPVIAEKMRDRKLDHEREDEQIRKIEAEHEEGEINDEEAEELKLKREEEEAIKKLEGEIAKIRENQKKRENEKKEKIMQEIEKLETQKKNVEAEIEAMKMEIVKIEERIADKKFDVTKLNVAIKMLRQKFN